MKIVAVRVPEDMKKKMKEVSEDWSSYLRGAIENRLLKEERKNLLKKIGEAVNGIPRAPKGTGSRSIRESRDGS